MVHPFLVIYMIMEIVFPNLVSVSIWWRWDGHRHDWWFSNSHSWGNTHYSTILDSTTTQTHHHTDRNTGVSYILHYITGQHFITVLHFDLGIMNVVLTSSLSVWSGCRCRQGDCIASKPIIFPIENNQLNICGFFVKLFR